MFNAIPSERRDKVRAFMSGVPVQAGTFLAGLLLLVGGMAFSPPQLAWVGFVAGLVCTFVMWRAGRAYNLALVDALRLGRPQVFFNEGDPFAGFRKDSAALRLVLAGTIDEDLVTRRVSTEILGQVYIPEAEGVLLNALND